MHYRYSGTRALFGVILGLVSFLGESVWAQSKGGGLDLDTYLQQVRTQNGAFVSSERLEDAAELRRDESTMLTKPAFLASAQYVDDRRETGSPLQGSGTKSQNYSLGIRQETDFGLKAKLLYNFNQTSLEGVNTTFFPQPEYYTSGPVLELTQPLIRNGFGREIRASKELIDAQVKAQKFNESFRQTQLLAEAEIVYWRLTLARENVEATKETVERSKKLRAWSSRRANLNLGNRSDFLQTEAAFLSRNLELKAALDEEKAASRAFNTMRGIEEDVVSEKLGQFDSGFLSKLVIPAKPVPRDNVKAAEQQMRLAEANSRLGIEKNRPELNLFGTIGLNGRDPASKEAISESSGTSHPNYIVGVRLDMPFDLGTQSDNREGYRQEVLAAELAYKRRVFEEQRSWQNQSAMFHEASEQLQLAQEIEKAQREKMNYERTRQSRGLSTMFQVLQFEQDFANAQLARIRSQANILNIYSQLKTFGGGR